MASHKWKARVIVKNFLGVDYQLKLQLHCWLSDSTSLNTKGDGMENCVLCRFILFLKIPSHDHHYVS